MYGSQPTQVGCLLDTQRSRCRATPPRHIAEPHVLNMNALEVFEKSMKPPLHDEPTPAPDSKVGWLINNVAKQPAFKEAIGDPDLGGPLGLDLR